MTPNIEKRLRALRAGLLFCSEDHQPVIQAMIDALSNPTPVEVVDPEPKPPEANPLAAVDGAGSSSETNAGQTPLRLGEQADPSLRNTGKPGAPGKAVEARQPNIIPGDWRAARRQLRQAGHDVQQVDGIVYIDGRRSDDLGLYPS